MKKSLYYISMLVYAVSLISAFEYGSLAFMGYFFVGSFTSNDYAIVLSVVLTVIAMLFHTLAIFKSKKFIYVTRGILFLGSLFNLLVFAISLDMIISLIISVALLIMTFIEKTEYIVTNTVTEEELSAIEKEISDEKTKSQIGNVVTFFALPIVIVIGILIASIPFSVKYVNEMKEEYRSYYTSVMATDEQNAQFEKTSYTELNSAWQINTNNVTARIDYDNRYNDYWIIDDNVNFVLNLYYDDWDSVADKEILVNLYYKYPDMKTDKISDIRIGEGYDYDAKNPETYFSVEFTDEEKEMLRSLVLNEKYQELENVTITREQFYNADRKDIFWHFEGEDTLYLEQGNICKLEDGKYYFHEGAYSYNFYALPDEICKSLDNVWQA